MPSTSPSTFLALAKTTLYSFVLFKILPVEGVLIRETLVFTSGPFSPDNFPQPDNILLINGSFPGPTLYLHQNDTLELLVVNSLPSSFALHMHGLFQRDSLRSDGVPFVTQAPIPPNSSYLYQTQVGAQSGTFMYHAHTDLDLVFAHGLIIIQDSEKVLQHPEYFYEEERLLTLSQCWHVSLSGILNGLEGAPFEDVPDTASLLVNGRSYGIWDENANRTDGGYTVITVRQGAKYRFRVIGLGMDSMLQFKIDNHTQFKVIEVDGILTDPIETDRLDLNSAQRYSILLEANQPVGNYWIRSEMYPGPGPRNGRAILHYVGAPDPELTGMRREVFPGETEEMELDNWILNKLHPSTLVNVGEHEVPKEVDKEIVIRSMQRNLEDGRTRFDINGQLLRPHNEGPVLIDLLESGEDLLSDSRLGVQSILLGQRIQLVFQNSMSDDGECEQHPWHLHGHAFHVVAEGPDSYDETRDHAFVQERVENATTSVSSSAPFLVRDVVTLFPSQETENVSAGAGCGWVAIRFEATNPGLWLVHCHLTPHQIMGKHFVLWEHADNGAKGNQTETASSYSLLMNMLVWSWFS